MSHDPKKIRKFYGVLKGSNMTAHKEDLLAGYDAESLNDLTPAQLDELIKYLVEKQDEQNTPARRKAMSHNIALLEEMGIYKKPNPWARVNNYVKQPRVGGKEMFRMTTAELRALGRKLYAIQRAELEKEIRAKTLADHEENAIDDLLTAIGLELDAEQS